MRWIQGWRGETEPFAFTMEEANSREIFTTKDPARQSRTESRNISRKDAKVAKGNPIPNLAFLASWREPILVFNGCGPLQNLR